MKIIKKQHNHNVKYLERHCLMTRLLFRCRKTRGRDPIATRESNHYEGFMIDTPYSIFKKPLNLLSIPKESLFNCFKVGLFGYI